MAVELTLTLTIENSGAGQQNINGDTIPKLSVEEMRERGFFTEDGQVSIDSGYLTIDPEDDSFFLFDVVDAKDVI